MTYLGISNDDKYVFMNEGFYYLENGKSKFIKYSGNFLNHLCEMYKSNVDFEYNHNLITLQEKLLSSKKFINVLLESFNISDNNKLNYIVEWDKNFESVYLINENTNSLVIENIFNDSWVYVNTLSEGLWDDIKSGAGRARDKIKNLASSGFNLLKQGLSKVAQKVILPIIKQGVIPLMRWIRRNLNTYLGVIVDVILSLLPTVIVMKVVWGLIVLLDIYEIATGDYDPDDPERKNMPFVFLITDLISLLFTAAAGKTAKVTLNAGLKKGATSPVVKTLLKSLLDKLPALSGVLKNVQKFLLKTFGKTAGGIVSKLFGFVDSVITKLVNWIKNIVGATAAEAVTKKGLTKVGVGAAIGVGIAEFLMDKSFGEGKSGEFGKGKYITQIQNNLLAMTNEGDDFNVGYKGPVTGVYDKATGDAVYRLYQKLNMTPKREATPYIANMLGVVLEPSGLFKIIPEKITTSFGDFVQEKSNKFASLAKKMGAKGV